LGAGVGADVAEPKNEKDLAELVPPVHGAGLLWGSRPQVSRSHDVGGVLLLVCGLLEVSRLARPKRNQASRRQNAQDADKIGCFSPPVFDARWALHMLK
jgi:hypothetical protein